MSLNTSNTPDGRGVLIYNGEMILLYTTNVKLVFYDGSSPLFKGGKSGALYLTSHRIIFMNGSTKDLFKSFSMPFQTLRNVKLEQPLLAPNYLKGRAQALPDGNFEGEVQWRFSFPKGGCVEFGQALLRAADIASRMRLITSPPAYMPSPAAFYCASPAYYISKSGQFNGFQAPIHVFPEQPPVGNVYMYEAPPPYVGIGQAPPVPAGTLQYAGTILTSPTQQYASVTQYNNVTNSSLNPPAYTPYVQAQPLPQKQ